MAARLTLGRSVKASLPYALPRPDAVAAYRESNGWLWAAFLYMAAVLMQVVLQAQVIGQVIRSSLGLGQASLFKADTFELVYNLVMLTMLIAAVHGYDRERRETWRREHPISYWTFAGGLALQAYTVGKIALGIEDGILAMADPSIVVEPARQLLLDLDLNLAILAAMAVGFIGLGVDRDTPLGEDLTTVREREERVSQADSYIYLGRVERARREFDAAHAMFQESLRIARQSGDANCLARSLQSIADLSRARGRYAEALETYAKIMTVEERIAREARGRRGGSLDMPKNAAAAWQVVLAGHVAADGVATCFRGLAQKAVAGREHERAARLYGAAEAIGEATGQAVGSSELAKRSRIVAVATAGMDPKAFWSAWAAGRRMAPQDAVRYALEQQTRVG